MLSILYIPFTILLVLFFFGFCIFIHELGHLLAALYCGLHVERFSVGFGKAIYKRRYRNIDFIIGWIPFGGYVALPQLEPSDSPHTHDGQALPAVEPWKRMITAVAGPLFNILFGFVLASIIWVVGMPGRAAVESVRIGYIPETYTDSNGRIQETPEYQAGFQAGDQIVAINGKKLKKGWEDIHYAILYAKSPHIDLEILRDGQAKTIHYSPVEHPDKEGLWFTFIEPYEPIKILKVLPDSPADRAGLKVDDRILELNGKRVVNRAILIEGIQAAKDKPVSLEIERDGREENIQNIRPTLMNIEGKDIYAIGIAFQAIQELVIVHPTPWELFTSILGHTYKTLLSLFNPNNPISPKHMSGPVGIVNVLFSLFYHNIIQGIWLVVLITFNLAVLNLLPIPVLDGGHILQGAIEICIRRRLPTRLVVSLQYTFAVLLISFMLYVSYYDLRRLPDTFRRFFPQTQQPEKAKPTVNPPPAPEKQ